MPRKQGWKDICIIFFLFEKITKAARNGTKRPAEYSSLMFQS
jgi:hypothetical protein